MTLDKLPTPSFVIDKGQLIKNLEILKGVEERTGAHILLAQKAFSAYCVYPLIRKYLSGSASSGLFEARLAHEYMGGESHVFCAAYRENEIDEISRICGHVIFNSFSQAKKYKALCLGNGASCGIRLNPEFSTQGGGIYDPCAPFSRMGVTLENFREEELSGIEGFHIHTLCEQGAEDLAATVAAAEEKFGKYFAKAKWLNLGGGHHITKKGYNIPLLEKTIKHLQETYDVTVYLEPGEAVALDAGYMVTTVLDIIKNGKDIAILDTSAACHMPDVLEMPYRPPLRDSGQEGEKKYSYILGSQTCLSGDVIGTYSFDKPLSVGDRLIFEDMAIYTMCKTNTFNGLPLPSIALMEEDGSVEIVRSFGYEDFKERLS